MRSGLTGFLMVVLGLCAMQASAGEKTLFNFENGTQGWWKYSSPESKVELSKDDSGAGSSSGSLKVVFQYAGSGPYLGLGVQPKYALGGSGMITDYAGGHLHLSLKGSSAFKVRVELRCADKKTYSFNLPAITTDWADYNIAITDFKSKEEVFPADKEEIAQLVVIPLRSGADEQTLWMDNITISSEPAPAK